MRRPYGHFVLLTLFALLAGNAFHEAFNHYRNPADVPRALLWLQLSNGTLALIALAGIWRRARWNTYAVVMWGLFAAGMVLSLDPLLDIGPEGRPGLWWGAAFLLSVMAVIVWYLRKDSRRPLGDHGTTP